MQIIGTYVLRAVIYSWDLENHKDVNNDLNKAIEIDDQYAFAYAVRGSISNWALSINPAAKKDLGKANEESLAAIRLI